MNFDFSAFFKRYEAISAMADQVFEKVRQQYPGEVTCETRCADCCHALFDLTLIEAVYINHHFAEKFNRTDRDRLIEKANKADRHIYKIKRKAFQSVASGKSEADVLEELAMERERCTMLNDEELCDLYDYRPITCRLYGIPTAIGGKGHTCGKSSFAKGKTYPTVNLDKIQKMLYELSDELAKAIKSPHANMGEILVPLSMAILTDYDEEYFGLKTVESTNGADNKGDANG